MVGKQLLAIDCSPLTDKQKGNPKDEAISGRNREGIRDCKKLRFTVYELRLTKNPKL